jgi:hypothetical protein
MAVQPLRDKDQLNMLRTIKKVYMMKKNNYLTSFHLTMSTIQKHTILNSITLSTQMSVKVSTTLIHLNVRHLTKAF